MSFSDWSNKKKKKDEEKNSQTEVSSSSSDSKNDSSDSYENGTDKSFSAWSDKKLSSSSILGWVKSSENAITEAQNRYKTWQGSDDEEEFYSNYRNRISDLLAGASTWRNTYSNDKDTVEYIDRVVSELENAQKYASGYHEHYSQFASAEEYETAVKEAGWLKENEGKSYDILRTKAANPNYDEDYREWLSKYAESVKTKHDWETDIWSINVEIKNIEKDMEAWDNTDDLLTDEQFQAHEKKYIDKYGSKSKAKKQLADLRVKKRQYENVVNYGYISENEDFEEFAKKGAAIENPSYEDVEGGMEIFGWRPFSEDPNNIVTYSRDNLEKSTLGLITGDDTQVANPIYRHMTEDEVNVYNYLLAKYGEEKAQEYLDDYLMDILNQREGQQFAKAVREADNWGQKLFWGGSIAIGAGLEQWAEGTKQLFSDEARPITATQYAANQISQDLDGVGKVAFDLTRTTANMAPSILLSYMTGSPTAGKVAFFTSPAGNAYGEALRAGYDTETAGAYGTLIGVSEVTLQSLLGGIGSLGGINNVLKTSIQNIDNALLRVSAKLGISMLGEGTEEYLQEILDPVYRNMLLGEDNEFKLVSEEAAYAFLLGSLSAGFLEGLPTAVNYIGENANLKKTYGEEVEALIDEALEINPNNEFAKKLKARLDAGKNITGGQIATLINMNERGMVANDTTAITDAAASRLSELGETGDVYVIAEAIAKQAAGQKLTKAEQRTISNSKYGQRVANELNPKNIGSYNYTTEWAEKIGTDRINPEEYSRLVEEAQITQEGEESPEGITTTPIENVPKGGTTEAVEVPEEIAQVEEPEAEEAEVIDEENVVTIEEASKKYGAQAVAMIRTYHEGQDVAKYDAAYEQAYNMGNSGVSLSYAMNSESTAYLTETQRELAYEAGKAASDTAASEKDAANKKLENGKTGRKKGVVRGRDVTISDLKKTFNDKQNTAYKLLSTYAEATGIDIVLYRSEANAEGLYEGAQGEYHRKSEPGTIYIDLNAGLENIKSVNDLAKYTMLRTFAHEFTHFIENWNPVQYNEFRKVVFDTLTERGENVQDLIEEKQAANSGMTYDQASREVVAEAMTDILPDANFVEKLATDHKRLFGKLIEKLKEFVNTLRGYFNSIGHNRAREANALKEQVGDAVQYVESIVKLFDKVAVQAVENYQATVAVDEVVETVDDTVDKTKSKTKVAESKTKTEPKTTTSEHGFTITDNTERGSLEITFDEKPSEAVRDILKENKFRWHGKKKVWYGFAEREAITDALNKAYENESVSETETKPSDFETAFWNATQEERDEVVDAITENTKISHIASTEIREQVVPEEAVSKTEAETNKKKGPRTEEEKQLARKRQIGAELRRLLALSPERQKYLSDKHNEYSEILAQLEEGDKLINDNGDVVGKVVNISDNCIFIVGEEGFAEIIFPKSFTADGIISILEVGDGHFEKTDGTRIAATELTENIEEATTNGTENVDNGQTVLGSDPDGQGTSRLLDESQVEDVQGTSSERGTVADSSERGAETSRDGDRTDTADRSGRSERDSEVGDLRRDDELTPEQEAEAKAEQLHEEVETQIEQKSTEKPKGNNFVIGDSLNLPAGEKARFRANVDAIRLIKQLEAEGRFATAAEQELLSKYVGWGGLDKAFGEMRYNRETRRSEMTAKDGWSSEFEELRSLVDEGVITEQEYKDMSASTKNAHYTSVDVIKAMYDGLAQLGFKGGRMLEPSSGVGNFVGAMPSDMSAKVNSWTMVELDRITGQIAKHLYPNSDVRIQGFETANIPDNYMDVAIGNVPFGNFGVVDRTYPKRVTKSIHNYFFAKSLDKVRPGGIVMFITSSFTMDSKDSAIRQYMMERADLLGAIRLPNTSFKDNAGTEVVTDILVLKKREGGTEYSGEDFLNAEYDYKYGSHVSDYFKAHPEMVLGTPTTKRGMYGANTLTYEPFTDRGTIGEQIREAFKNIKGEMSYTAKLSPEKTNFAVERATKKTKAGGFVVNKDGSISRSENGQLVKYDTDEKTAKRITGMLGIRDAYRTLANYLQQGLDAKTIKQARKALNTAYDAFVKEYGYLNSPANKKAIDSDPDSYSILSLENYDVKKKTATKADIFTKDTISANKTVTHVDSVSEGVIASLNLTGGVDTELIAKLTSRSVEDVTSEIIDSRLAFKTRNGTLVARESYLAGNVRAKLREAESLVPYDKDYEHNVEELRRVIPKDIPYNEIYITPGATFIPNEVYADFIAHMLGGRNNPNSYSGPDVEVGRTISGEFKINLNNKRLKNSYYNTQTWGTSRKSFLDLIDAMMGSRTVKVNDTVEGPDGKKISVLNEAETEAANEKIKAIQKEFEEWLWKDENRRTELARLYNETFNAIVNPKYDGSNLTVNGLNAGFTLREHQANAVHRIISSGGNTLLAHRVGAGKTLEMAAAAMKLRELGVVKKPVFVVPKSLVAQWGVEFHSYFPASRILVADDKSFTPANRKIFTNKIANGDYDAVIVSYEQFEKIPMSAEYQKKFYEEQIDEIIAAIAEEKAESRDGKGLTVKEMEKKKAALEKKLKELTSKPKDEDNIDFEMLGIDSLFVDEAHNFKNLEYVSKMSNVAGLGSAKGSQRAFDLYTKVRYLQGMNGGRGIVFATATPVMNSMVELYIMQRYLQPDVLDQLGLKSFDAWAKQFGEVVNKWEINPSGTGMRQKQVFANFRNLNELQLLFRSFSDVLTEVPGLKIPKMKGGSVKIVECEPGQFQKDYMLQLQKRAEVVKSVDPSIDNMLKITSDGRKVSYTQRMIDPSLPYEAGCKIYRCCENVLAEYKDSSKIKGTQIIFCDMATPKGTDKSKADNTAESIDTTFDEGSAKLYDDIRAYLVKNGIPAKEIAFIHEADSDAKRKQLFADVNDGKVRILIGSTGKMGVGMNAQQRIVAIHHLDAPWRPGDVEQRDGRAFRQKNMNEEVSKYVYVTKGSFDSRLWDILDRKQHFIAQIMNGEDVGRTAEDTGEVTLSAAEVKALASGNPLIEEQTKLTDAIKKLENLQKAYNSSIRLAKTKLSDDEQKIAYYTTRIGNIREDIKSRVDTYSEGKFSMNIGGQVFTDKKEAGAALAAEIAAKAGKDSYVTVATFAGFELKVLKEAAEYKGLIQGKATYKFNVYLTNTTRMVNHIGDIIAGFENQITNAEQLLSDVNADLKAQQEIIAKPFEKAEELAEKRARFNEVMELLAPKTEQQHGNDSDGDVQYQSRAYLKDSDTAYMDAVNNGDMETAQKMVEEAARRAGYTVKVLRGTNNFSRTKPKSSKLFFATDAVDIAKTYANNPTVRTLDSIAPKPSKAELAEFRTTVVDYANEVTESLASWIEGYTDIDSKFNSVVERNNEYIEEYSNANNEKKSIEFAESVQNNLDDVYNEAVRVAYDLFEGDENALNKALEELKAIREEYTQTMGSLIQPRHRNSGIHEMFANTEGHLVIDAKGAMWNNIKSDVLPTRNEAWTTDDIAEWAQKKGYTGVTIHNVLDSLSVQDKPATDYVFFNRTAQVKSADTVTYDKLGRVIPLSKRFNENKGDIRYQQRTSALTNREILAMAASDVNIGELTPGEQDALNIFQKHLARLEELQEQRMEQGRLYKEQQFGEKVDRKAAEETLNRMHILDEQIRAENDDLFTIEEKAVLRKVLEKARKVIEQTEREHGQEILRRWRDRRNNAAAIKKYRERLRADVDELTDWVLHPNNKDVVKHIPDALKNSVIPFLSSINFMSKQALKGGKSTIADKEFMKRLNDLKATLKPHANPGDMYNGYTDLPENFMDRLDTFITSAQALVDNNNGEFIINQMTADELKELSQVVRTLKKYIQNFNRFHVNAMFQHVYEAGDDTILSLGALKSAGPHTGSISNFVLWQQMRPAYAFERFGDGGKAIYDGLRRGQATLAFNTKTIQEFAEKAYTEKEVKAWEKEIKEIRVGGDIIKMPVATIMSFYELSKRPQALGHILGEGIRVATFKANGKKISDVGHTITRNDIDTIIGTLTPRQKEVADSLQKFMQEQGGKWGNYVSVKRFGEELFGEENYFPINSDGRHLSVNAEEHPAAASLYALLNMGFTKSTQEGANNRLVLYSIFDVFANHMASMAQYNAFALPIVDAIKWFNYQQKSEPDENGKRAVLSSVRDQMDRVYGVPEETKPGSGRQGYAQNFVINILKAFNGTEAQGVPTDTTGLNVLRRYNMAQVAYNLRVVMQQPMAITRAAQLLDYSSIIKGMKLNSKAIKLNIKEMQKYSGIAAWKSLGFYDTNISRGLTEIIKHRSNVLDKIGDVGMWGAEKADLLTWAAMWSAAKQEVIKKQKLTPKSEGFYEAVTQLFEDVIYKTQVVDSVLTKNEFLRSKGFWSRAMGSFMSEPTTTASMLVDAFDKYHADIQRGFSKGKAWQRNKGNIVRTAYVYGIGAVLLAAVQAVADAGRDDDEYEEWYEKWLEAFKGNVIDEILPVNKLPIMSDFYEAGKELLSVLGVDTYGNAPQSVFMQWYDSLIKGTEILHDKISGEDTNYTWYGGAYKLLQAISGMSGLPMATTTREIVTAWNYIVGGMAPSLKVKSYESSDKSQIKYAYLDGYLTAEEATEQLIEKGVVDNENEAYFTIAEWGDPDGSYSRYDNLYDAARNGGDFDAAMDELVSHGYTEKDVLSQLKGKIGEWYKGGEITKQQATNMLTKHFDLDDEEITSIVNKWSSKVVTGIEFDDIKDEYLSGNITASRAAEMYVRYGGYTKAEAKQKVSEWDFEGEHGFKYSNRGEQFKEGNISATELVNYMVNFGGKSKDEARSSLVGYTKSGYEEGYFTRSKAVDIMVEHGGLTKDEAEAKVQHIDFQREYPEYDLSESQVTTYYSELASTGLGVPEYAQYVEERKGIKGVDADGDGKTDSGSVKSQVMIVIDSLPITTEQKDALYYMNGWAASRIYEAPWH